MSILIIGIFADVHGNLPALEAVLEDGRRNGVERWFCLGDLAFRGPAPEECTEVVRALGDRVAIKGNTEEWLPVGPPDAESPDPVRRAAIRKWWEWTIRRLDSSDIEWVESLPTRLELDLEGHRLLCVHATARHPEEVVRPWAADGDFRAGMPTQDFDIVACAHIHTPYLRRVDRALVFNTGSTGRPIDGDPRSSYVIVHLDGGHTGVHFRRVPYAIDATERLAHERGFPWATEYIAALRKGENV